MARKAKHVRVNCRDSQLCGQLIDRAETEGDAAPVLAGSAAHAKKRPRRHREIVYGTVVKSVAKEVWEVQWDAPNYLADKKGITVSTEVSRTLTVEEDGAGTGPRSPNARR
jgi:ribosomal protein S25